VGTSAKSDVSCAEFCLLLVCFVASQTHEVSFEGSSLRAQYARSVHAACRWASVLQDNMAGTERMRYIT
jgi:hypothetical protein